MSEETELCRRVHASIPVPASLLSPSRIFLTPESTPHPIVNTSGAQRCVWDGRAFSYPLTAHTGEQGALIVKGGDLVSDRALRHYGKYVAVGVFPGSSIRLGLERAFDAAITLQKAWAVTRSGFAPTLIPLSLRRIDTIEQGESLVPARDFIDQRISREQLESTSHTRGFPGTPSQYLFDRCKVEPCELIYYLQGSPLKVIELRDLTLSTSEAVKDPRAAGLLDNIPEGEIVLSAFTHLLHSENLHSEELADARDGSAPSAEEACRIAQRILKVEGHADVLAERFITRTCALAALGHSLGLSFSDRIILYNGCLDPSNTTISGSIVDLDNVHSAGPYALTNPYYVKDVMELKKTAGLFCAVLGESNTEPAEQRAESLYKEFLSRDLEGRI